MRSNHTPEKPTQPDNRVTAVVQEETPSTSGARKTGLMELLASVNHKLDELTSANQDLLRMIDSPAQGEPVVDDLATGHFARAAISEDETTEPELAYRLFWLADLLRQWYDFEECAVFLLEGEEGTLEKLVSSGSRAGERGLEKFEDEVRALRESGDIARAVGERKRLILPARSGGSLLIIPFEILGKETGFWAMHFKEESSPQEKVSVELPLWTELISACIENSRLNRLPSLDEKPYCSETEKLFSTAEISRAVVHEANNCLQVILGRTQLLMMNENKTRKAASGLKVLETIETNANRVCSILKDFSDHLRRQSGKSSGQKEVNARRILESNLVFLRYILKSDRIKLELDLEENLPPVCGDPGELELALLSLIWGLRDQLRAEGSIRVQVSAEANALRMEMLCTPEDRQGDKHPDSADLELGPRFRLASEILKGHRGEVKFERPGGREVHLTLTLPTVAERKTSPDKPLELESSSTV
jgi:hypothetical protein